MKNIKQTKQIAVWMDHTSAKLIEPGTGAEQTRVILSPYQGKVRIAGEGADGTQLGNHRSTNNESHKHFTQQNELHAYYKQLASELLSYDDILVFGPSTAHSELHNYLLGEKKFSGKNIVAKKADYITENQIREAAGKFFDREVKIFNKIVQL